MFLSAVLLMSSAMCSLRADWTSDSAVKGMFFIEKKIIIVGINAISKDYEL